MIGTPIDEGGYASAGDYLAIPGGVIERNGTIRTFRYHEGWPFISP